jgi:hypothetical protein
MRSKQRPIRYHDFHLPLARELFLKETGLWSDNPPRAIRKRAALMQGRGTDFTEPEMDVAMFAMSMWKDD